MSNLTEILNVGAGNAWLFAPSAILLGALHGLEPGHSKTMMAAFIIAIRGTVAQAILLGLAATLSHTAIVWIIALGGLYFGSKWTAEGAEPYLQIVSGLLIIGVAGWMSWRNWRDHHGHAEHSAAHHGHEHHDHEDHEHDHHHDHDHAHAHAHDHDDQHDHLHPHARGYQGHHHRNFGHPRHERPQRRAAAAKDARFKEDLLVVDPEAIADAHEREHALEINRRFAGRKATTGEIALFGLTGGLIPCPAAITVLLLCLQLGKIALGAALVLCFSVGLALTMVLVGVAAALSLRHVSTHWTGFETFARVAPYVSGALVAALGLYTLYLGASALA
jgi:nickel/cobalt transporter (NicO) family protein